MVNLDSELARQHPDWILRGRDELPVPARQQYVLDLANEGAWQYLLERLDTLLDDYDIAYLKWDHNRDLLEAGAADSGRARVHDNVEALYRLLAALKRRHPDLEIESCASGGARVDLGILEHTDRIWTSDTLDPVERLQIQRYTGLIVPPEMMGAHLTSPAVHSTGRQVSLDLSAGVAMFGHLGIEWDLTALDEAGLAAVARWVELHKRHRELIHTGALVHGDTPDATTDVRGVVARDGASALFTFTQVSTSVTYPPGRFTLPGLDADRRYSRADRRGQRGRRTRPVAAPLGRAADHADRPATRRGGPAGPRAVPRAARAARTHLRPPPTPSEHRPPDGPDQHPERARRRTMTDEITRPSPHRRRRTRPRRALAAASAIAIGGLLLSGCASPATATSSRSTSSSSRARRSRTSPQIIADFEAENPDIKVVQNQVADADTIIRTLLVKDKAPDVITLNANGGFGRLAQAGVFYDFSDEPVLDTINPAVQEILARPRQQGGRGQRPRLREQRERRHLQPGRSSRSRGSRCPRRGTSSSPCATRSQDAGITPFYGTLADSWTGLPSFNALGAYPAQGDFFDQMREEGENVGPDSEVSFEKDFRRGAGAAVRALRLHAGGVPRQDLRRRQRRVRQRRGRDAHAGHLGDQPGQGGQPRHRRGDLPVPAERRPRRPAARLGRRRRRHDGQEHARTARRRCASSTTSSRRT